MFLGDSITAQCLYTQYVENYFYTRYPHLRMHFHNAGVSGDTAADALARFDRDVAAYKPNYVAVLLGMNDGAAKQFETALFDTYRTDMQTLIARIRPSAPLPILLTPTMYDARMAAQWTQARLAWPWRLLQRRARALRLMAARTRRRQWPRLRGHCMAR